jgi:hypothetical protein
MEMDQTRDPSRDGKDEDNLNNEQPMVCPFCGWEATDGEYVMLLVRSLHSWVPLPCNRMIAPCLQFLPLFVTSRLAGAHVALSANSHF